MTARGGVALGAAACTAALAACAADTGPRHIVGPVFFGCDDGTLLTVRFDHDDGTARVIGADGLPIVLNVARSGSGYWYINGLYSLRGKGRDARWQAPGRAVTAAPGRRPRDRWRRGRACRP